MNENMKIVGFRANHSRLNHNNKKKYFQELHVSTQQTAIKNKREKRKGKTVKSTENVMKKIDMELMRAYSNMLHFTLQVFISKLKSCISFVFAFQLSFLF